MVFNDTINNYGLVQQARSMMRVDATQWPTWKIVNSANNWLDFVAGYMIGNDKRFAWDDTNHSKLPEGTTPLVLGQKDYSFLTDEQGNRILTLLGMSLVESDGTETVLKGVDWSDGDFDKTSYGTESGTPSMYDKISDNIIRLDTKPTAGDVTKYSLKFRFQRTPSYFTTASTTKEPGVPTPLHRGFMIAAAYDGALSLGLKNVQILSVEQEKERQKIIEYYAGRNNDVQSRMTVNNSGANSNR
jgi:hypothetical protein